MWETDGDCVQQRNYNNYEIMTRAKRERERRWDVVAFHSRGRIILCTGFVLVYCGCPSQQK